MDGSLPSSSAFESELVARRSDEVSRKLRGGVWERSELARGTYGAVLSFGRWLSDQGVTPNALTYAALLVALASGVAAALSQFVLAAALLLLSGALDLLDGVVARAAQRTSRFGALLDSTVDRLADALPLLGLVVACGRSPLAAAVLVTAMMTGFAVSYVRARAEGLGIQLPPLFMRRAERLVFLLVALLAGSFSWPGLPDHAVLLGIIAVMAVLSLVAAVWAMRAAYVTLALEDIARVSAPATPTPSRP
jgi:CDP-diacylglycerol---glycerol-3-phosphate 3-phosphatidyltransferase